MVDGWVLGSHNYFNCKSSILFTRIINLRHSCEARPLYFLLYLFTEECISAPLFTALLLSCPSPDPLRVRPTRPCEAGERSTPAASHRCGAEQGRGGAGERSSSVLKGTEGTEESEEIEEKRDPFKKKQLSTISFCYALLRSGALAESRERSVPLKV